MARTRSRHRPRPAARASALTLTRPDESVVVRGVTQRTVAGFEPESVAALLHAACCSPGAMHRVPSLAGMWVAFHSDVSDGCEMAGPADLERWVRRMRNAVPQYERVEDWVPLDARLTVQAQHRGGLWPLHPGSLERPGELIVQFRRWASVADEELIRRRGFGIGDLLEVALRMLAAERRRLAPHWAAAVRPVSPDAPAIVTAGEIDAARDLLSAWQGREQDDGLPALLLDPHETAVDEEDPARIGRLGRALEFATVPVEQLVPYPYRQRTARPVPALAVRAHGRVVPVPGGLLLEGLTAVVSKLFNELADGPLAGEQPGASAAGLAQRLVYNAEGELQDSASNLLAHLVPARTEAGGRRCWLMCPAARHVVAIQVVAGFSGRHVHRAIERARRDLRLIKPGGYLHTWALPPAGSVLPEARHLPVEPALVTGPGGRVREDAVVTRVVLVEGAAWAQLRRHRGAVVLTLDEWRYLVARVSDPEQLWAFLDELALLPGIEKLDSFDVRDVWAIFQERGVINDGAAKHHRVFVPVQDLEADWRWAAQVDDADAMLHSWEMPGVGRWPSHTVDDNGLVTLTDARAFGWMLLNPRQHLAVGVFDPDSSFDHGDAVVVAQSVHDTLASLAESAQDPDASAQMRAGWAAVRDACGGQPLLIMLRGMPLGSTAAPARLLAVHEDMRILVAFDQQRLRYAGTAAAHQALGTALADAVLTLTAVTAAPPPPDMERVSHRMLADRQPEADAARDTFLDAWTMLAPQLRVVHLDVISAREATVFVPAQLSEPGRARAGRVIAKALLRAGVTPRRATEADAISLLYEVNAAALDALYQELAHFDRDSSLHAAAEEVERFWELRHHNYQQRAVSTDTPTLREVRADSDESLAGRASDLLVEALLHKPPSGSARLDHRDWIRLLHLAGECVHLSQNLSAARCGLMQLDVEVTAEGVVSIETAGELTDLPEHHLQRAVVNAAVLATLVDDGPREPVTGEDRPFRSLREELRRIAQQHARTHRGRTAAAMLALDQAMLTAMGAGLDEINAVLATAASWPVPGDPDTLIAVVPVSQLADSAAAWSGLDPARVTEAVRWLTLTPALITAEGLRYWSLEGRDARLALRPFLQLAGATAHAPQVMIMPRRAAGTRQLVGNYLGDSRLPWPDSVLPPAGIAAQRAWRQLVERTFEVEVDQLFNAHGLSHRRANLTPAAALRKGLVISGEIDELAADPARRILWVAEAKDPHVPFDADQLLYEVVEFNGVTPDIADRVRARQAKSPEKSYVGKLLAKAAQVRDQLSAALTLLGVDTDTDEPWEVIPLMITSRPTVAATAPNPRVVFTTPSGLESVLTAGISVG